MKQENWFFTPMWFDYVNFDTAAVAKTCMQLKENDHENRVLSNVGGWQSSDLNLNDYSEFKVISDILNQKLSEISSSIHPDLRLRLDNIWININEKGNMNSKHVHPVSTFSGTIYIQVDENTGRIVFFDDYNPIKHYPINLPRGCNMLHQTVIYTPKNGMILIFPSWTPHEVEPSRSDLTRISMSFNIRQV